MFGLGGKLIAHGTGSSGIELVGYQATTGTSGATSQVASMSSLTGGIGSSPAADDVILVLCHFPDAVSRTISTPSGYTTIAKLQAVDSWTTNYGAFYKVATGSETNVTVGTTVATARAYNTTVFVFRGVDTSNVLDVTSTTKTQVNSSDITPNTLTTVSNNCMVLHTSAHSNAATSVTVTASNPAVYDQFLTTTINAAPAPTIAVGLKLQETAGVSTTTLHDSSSNNTNNSAASVTLALRPKT